jgi:predicted N-acetyltransferase YhbS
VKNSGLLVIGPLEPIHNRRDFSCGQTALDTYLKQGASQDLRRRIARVYVCTEADSPIIIGFYTLSALSVELHDLPADKARRLPKHPLPAALLGRLAVSRQAQGQGVGRMLIADAIKRVITASSTLGIYALVVDAKDQQTAKYYEQFGFLPFSETSKRLFLPLEQLGGD